MTTRTMGPASGWRWLMNAVNLGGGNPGAVLGGAALLMLVGLVPSVLQLLVQNVLGMASQGIAVALMLLSVLYTLAVMGPLFVGYLRVLQASETGAPTRASAIFDVFSDRQAVVRVACMLLGLLGIGLLLFGVVAALLGGGFFEELLAIMQALEEAEATGAPPALPPMPSGFGTLMALTFIIGVFFNGVYALALGQVALGNRGAGGALVDGLVGALRNVLPLLVLTVVGVVAGIVLLLVVGLVIALLVGIGSLVSPVVGMALAVPVYLVAMVVLYVVMFGVAYYMWRDVCGGGTDGPAGDQGGNGQVAA